MRRARSKKIRRIAVAVGALFSVRVSLLYSAVRKMRDAARANIVLGRRRRRLLFGFSVITSRGNLTSVCTFFSSLSPFICIFMWVFFSFANTILEMSELVVSATTLLVIIEAIASNSQEKVNREEKEKVFFLISSAITFVSEFLSRRIIS